MIFLDSSFIIGYKIENDEHHHKAIKLMGKISEGTYGKAVISDYVFDESVTVLLNKSKDLSVSIELGNELRNSLKIMSIDKFVFEESWELFKEQKNTKLSFTDCTIITVMKNNGIENIATFDEDFNRIKGINVAG